MSIVRRAGVKTEAQEHSTCLSYTRLWRSRPFCHYRTFSRVYLHHPVVEVRDQSHSVGEEDWQDWHCGLCFGCPNRSHQQPGRLLACEIQTADLMSNILKCDIAANSSTFLPASPFCRRLASGQDRLFLTGTDASHAEAHPERHVSSSAGR